MTQLLQVIRIVLLIPVLLIIFNIPRWEQHTMITKTEAVAKRFFKMFILGGIASIAVLFTTIPTISSVTDLKKFCIGLFIAFFTGGFAAIEKSSSWIDTPTA